MSSSWPFWKRPRVSLAEIAQEFERPRKRLNVRWTLSSAGAKTGTSPVPVSENPRELKTGDSWRKECRVPLLRGS